MEEVPPEIAFEPRSPKYDPFSVLGLVDTSCAQSRPLIGHIVELEGNKELFVSGQLRCMYSVATVPLRLAVLSGF